MAPLPPPSPPDSEARSLGPEEVRRLQAAHAAAVKALEEAIRDTTRLTRLLTILGEPAPLLVLLDRVLSTISELYSSDVVVLLGCSEPAPFVPLAAIGIPEDRIQLPMSAGEGTALAATLRSNAPVRAVEGAAPPPLPPELIDLGVRVAAWLPVIGDEGVAAVMLLGRCRHQPFVGADLDLLMAMGYRIAVVLERARAEQLLHDARERLLQTEKLALAGKLAGTVGHELNNPLAAVRSNLGQLQRHVPTIAGVFRAAGRAASFLEGLRNPEAARHAEALRAILEGGDELIDELEEILADSIDGALRIGRLVSSFMRLASADRPVEPERQDVRAVIAECVADMPPSTGRPRLVHEAADEPPCVAWIAPAVLKAALTGLLQILLAPGLQRTDPSRAVVIRADRREGRPMVSVSDPVLVLSDEERRAIFDPRVEEVETPGGRTVRLSLLATLSYQLLRGCGGEVSTVVHGPHGLTVRILLPAPPEAGGGRRPT